MRMVVLGALVALGGCASQSGNMQVGTSQAYTSLKDQREAVRSIQVFSAVPEGYKTMGPVDASRCHRNTLDAAPSDEVVMTDLKVAAYAQGADGIVDVTVTKESGLLKNCWYIVTARGTMVAQTK